MNKIFYTLLITISTVFFTFVNAQSCHNSGSPCYATNFPDSAGFENPDSVPCVIQGVAYDTTIQLTMFKTFFAEGANQEVDSIQFLALSNLPCGLCWSSSNVNDRFSSGEQGCIRITGTTTDPVGQYKLQIKLNAWINHIQSPITTYPYTVDQSGIRMFVRVQSSSGNCTPVDTNTAFAGDTATCISGIAEINEATAGFSIIPNPMNNSAMVSFVAEKETLYTLQVNDITGRRISTNEIQAIPGTNKTAIERGTKPAGIYLVVLSGSNNIVTQRLCIVE